MAQNKKSDKRKRTEKIYFRVTPEEKSDFILRCENAGLTPADYLRKSALKTRPLNPTTDKQLIVKLLADWGRMGNNLNQIARHYNEGSPTDAELGQELIEVVRAVRVDIRKALGHDM